MYRLEYYRASITQCACRSNGNQMKINQEMKLPSLEHVWDQLSPRPDWRGKFTGRASCDSDEWLWQHGPVQGKWIWTVSPMWEPESEKELRGFHCISCYVIVMASHVIIKNWKIIEVAGFPIAPDDGRVTAGCLWNVQWTKHSLGKWVLHDLSMFPKPTKPVCLEALVGKRNMSVQNASLKIIAVLLLSHTYSKELRIVYAIPLLPSFYLPETQRKTLNREIMIQIPALGMCDLNPRESF